MWQKVVRRSATALVSAGLFVGPGAVPAEAASVLEVPGAYATIQAALDAAAAGDTIRVAPGDYHEQLTVNEDVTLESTGGAEVTRILWESGTAVTLRPPGSVIRGFTITGGQVHTRYGGGMKVAGGDHRVEDSVFQGCEACQGAGIYVGGGSVEVAGTLFTGNDGGFCEGQLPVWHVGMGIFVAGGELRVTDGRFGTVYGDYAGLWVDGGSAVIEGSDLTHQVSQARGGTLLIRDSDVVRLDVAGTAAVFVEDSTVSSEESTAAQVAGAGVLTVTDSTVSSAAGSALYVGAGGTTHLIHTTVSGGEESWGLYVDQGAAADIAASVLYAGRGGVYCRGSTAFSASVVWRPTEPANPPESYCSTGDLAGAILADPGLAGWPFDLRLRPGGGAVDLVPDLSWPHDLGGKPRPIDGDGDGTAWSDAGAWELVPVGVSGRAMSQNTLQPMAGVCVTAWVEGADGPEAVEAGQTGPDGLFFVSLPAGTYRFSFEDCLAGIYATAWAGGSSFETATPVALGDDLVAIGDVSLAVPILCLGKAATIVGTDDPETLVGTPGADVILGFGGKDTIQGLGGDDTLCGGDDVDRLEGGAGNDALDGGDGIDRLFGQDGADRLLGGPGEDELQGGPGDDRLAGGDDDDELIDREGNNSYDGGAGDDLIRAGPGDDRYVGGRGYDTLDMSHADQGLVLDLLAGTSSGDGSDTLRGIENVIGSDHADQMTGNRRGNRLEGGEGDDLLDGGAGNDVLLGGSDADVLLGGPGADRLISGGGLGGAVSGGPGNDVIEGGFGDLLSGDRGRDNITGGEGATEIYGGGEADIIHGGGDLYDYDDENYIDGGSGDDRLFGGACRDTLVGGPGDDFIDPGESAGYDIVWGGPGNDTISADPDDRGLVYVSFALAAGPVVADLASGTATGEGRDRLVGVFDGLVGSQYDDILRGTTEGDELLDGGPGADHIDGRSGRDKIAGYTGNDMLVGGADIDDLFGEEGDDRIMGDAGKDYLDGYLGTDSLDGGADDDICVDGEALTSCEKEYYRLAHRLPEFPTLVPWRRAAAGHHPL